MRRGIWDTLRQLEGADTPPPAALCQSAIEALLLGHPRPPHRPDLLCLAGGALLFHHRSAGVQPPLCRWSVLERVAHAAMEAGDIDLAERCVEELRTRFGKEEGSIRLWRIECLLLEATHNEEQALDRYNAMARALLSEDDSAGGNNNNNSSTNAGITTDTALSDTALFVGRRRVAVLRAMEHSGAAEKGAALRALEEHLHVHGADLEGHLELCAMHLQDGRHEAAAAALEEAILHEPHNHVHHTRYADILCTLGRHADARAHYARAIDLQEGAHRALYGMMLTATDGDRVASAAAAQVLRAYDDDDHRATSPSLSLQVVEEESAAGRPRDLMRRVAQRVVSALCE